MRGDATGIHQQFEGRQRAMFAASTGVELNGHTVALRLQPGQKPADHRPAFADWVRENAGTGFKIGETRGNQLVVNIEGAGNDPKEVYKDLRSSWTTSQQMEAGRSGPAIQDDEVMAVPSPRRLPSRPTPSSQKVDVEGPIMAQERAMFDAAVRTERNGHSVSLRFKKGVEPKEYAGTFKTWLRVNAGAGFTVKPNGQDGLKVMITGALNDPREVHAGLKSRIKSRPAKGFSDLGARQFPVKAPIPCGNLAANEAHVQLVAGQTSGENAPGSRPPSRPNALQQS